MTIQEKIQEDIKEAMRRKDSLRLDVLRGMKTAIKNKEIEKIKTLAEGEFSRGGRSDLAAREEAELKILESYLPAGVSDDKIKKVIAEVVAELQVTSPKDMGKVMKSVMGKFAGEIVDGKQISDLVRTQLGGQTKPDG